MIGALGIKSKLFWTTFYSYQGATFQGVTGLNFKLYDVFLLLKTVFILANSVDPGEVAFHLGLLYLFKVSGTQRV